MYRREKAKKDQKAGSETKEGEQQAQAAKTAESKIRARQAADDELAKFAQSLNQSSKKAVKNPKIADQRKSISTPEEDRTLMEDLLSDI